VLRVAADHPLKLMFPMVATDQEMRSALGLVADARRSLLAEGAAGPATAGWRWGS
jgi:phosphoenolpyruvate-protein kinase (PTS system EI component)